MNLDDLDFEWFIETHAAIEGYFEQIILSNKNCVVVIKQVRFHELWK